MTELNMNQDTARDQIQRFLFDQTAVRGELVQLQQSFQEVLACHENPPGIQEQLGQLLAAAALLTATVKLTGTLSLEVRGQGAVSLMMAECKTGPEGGSQLRALARYQGQPNGQDLQSLTGGGHLVITLDPSEGKRYQGIVALDQQNLAQCLEGYFADSEQLPTRLWLAADITRADPPLAAGLLLQQLPDDAQNQDPDAWNRLTHLAATVQQEELLALPPQQLLHRLYHEETLRLFAPQAVTFGCTCSRERTGEALVQLGRAQLLEVLEEQGQIETQCHFCNSLYHFDREAVDALLQQAAEAYRPEGQKLQ